MTRLSTLLVGPADSGIYRVADDAELDTVRDLADAARWRFVAVDTSDVTDRAGVFAALQEAFGLPDWFGHNLDALADALTDVTDEPGTLVVWTGAADFAEADPVYYRKILAALRGRSADDGAPGRFLTLLR